MLPLNQRLTNKDAPQMSERIRRVLQRDLDDIDNTVVEIAFPESYFEGEGRGLPFDLPGDTEDDKILHIRETQFPFKPADIGWFVHKVLLAKYPNGGEVDISSSKMTDRTSFWRNMLWTMGEVLYINLPYKEALKKVYDNVKGIETAEYIDSTYIEGATAAKAMGRLIRALRQPTDQRAWLEKRGARISLGYVVTIGADAPEGAIADVLRPDMEEVEVTTTITEVNHDESEDEDE